MNKDLIEKLIEDIKEDITLCYDGHTLEEAQEVIQLYLALVNYKKRYL